MRLSDLLTSRTEAEHIPRTLPLFGTSTTKRRCLTPTPAEVGKMAAKTQQELRDRIAEYRQLRICTVDKQALEAINSIIKEAEQQLRLWLRSAATLRLTADLFLRP
jgi:hypothetical protein